MFHNKVFQDDLLYWFTQWNTLMLIKIIQYLTVLLELFHPSKFNLIILFFVFFFIWKKKQYYISNLGSLWMWKEFIFKYVVYLMLHSNLHAYKIFFGNYRASSSKPSPSPTYPSLIGKEKTIRIPFKHYSIKLLIVDTSK